jgi:hypothetical protein
MGGPGVAVPGAPEPPSAPVKHIFRSRPILAFFADDFRAVFVLSLAPGQQRWQQLSTTWVLRRAYGKHVGSLCLTPIEFTAVFRATEQTVENQQRELELAAERHDYTRPLTSNMPM